MAASPAQIAKVLADLRDAARLRQASEEAKEPSRLSLGFAPLDEALLGGLQRGRLIELCGPRSSGRLSIALSALREAALNGEWVALVDIADGFDPRTAEAAGLPLDRLLWIRPRSLLDGFKAADLVLDAGGFGLVVVYLCGIGASRELRRFAIDAIFARLRQRAEHAQASVLVVADAPLFSGAGRLRTARAKTRWQRRLLYALDGTIAIELKHAGAPGEVPFSLELP